MKKLYIYLGSRKKQDIKLITVLQGTVNGPTRLTNLAQFELPIIWQKQIEDIIHTNRMFYEPFVDSANNYEELKKRFIAQGYKHVADGEIPLLNLNAGGKVPRANTVGVKANKSMIRKKTQ